MGILGNKDCHFVTCGILSVVKAEGTKTAKRTALRFWTTILVQKNYSIVVKSMPMDTFYRLIQLSIKDFIILIKTEKPKTHVKNEVVVPTESFTNLEIQREPAISA